MSDLGSLVDKRPFVRKMALGFRTLNAVFDALIDTLPGVIRAKHNDDGKFGNVREVALVTGNYARNGATSAASTKYLLQAQATDNALLPTEVTISSAGEITITFTSALTEDTYDVQVSGGLDDDGKPGIIAADDSAKTAAAVDVKMCQHDATFHNLTSFSITLHYGA